MNVFDLMAKISLDKSEYDSGMNEASEKGESTASKLGNSLKTAGKVATATITAVGTAVGYTANKTIEGMKSTAEYGDTIDKTSQKLGISTKTYQEYDYIMNLAGTSMQDMTVGMKTLTNQLDSAISGGADATANFQKLGISMDDLKTMSREDLFKTTIERLQQMEDSTDRASLANDLFGKSGQNLTPLFNMTNAETADLIKNLNDMGGVMSDDAVKASAGFKDAMTTLNVAIDGLKNGAMAELLPASTEILEGLTALFAGDESGLGKVKKGVEDLSDKLLEQLPKLLNFGSEVVLTIAEAIMNNLPTLTKTATEIVLKIANKLIENLPQIAKAGLEMITTLAIGIADNLPELMPTIVDVIIEIVNVLIDNLDLLLDATVRIMIALGEGLIKALPRLLEKVPTIIENLVTKLISIGGIKFQGAGADMIKGLWNGIKSGWSTLMKNVEDLAMGLIKKVKKIFGISSPSKVFAQIGEFCAEGFDEGIDELMDAKAITSNISSALKSTTSGISSSIGLNVSSASGSGSFGRVEEYCQNMLAIMAQYLPEMSSMQLVTDTGALVGALAPQMDAQLGLIAKRKQRG